MADDREALRVETYTFAHAIDSDVDDWTEEECRRFLKQFAASVLPLLSSSEDSIYVDGINPWSGKPEGTVECIYPKCDFEGTQDAVDEHLANVGTDPDHDWLQAFKGALG